MSDGTNVGKIYYTTTLDTQGLIDGEREARRAIGRMEDAGTSLERTMTRVGAAVAALFSAGAMVAGLKAMADAAGKFELALDNLQAITGITGERLKTVERAAMNFGKTTATSAAEAVEAMKLIASAKGELADNEAGLIAVTKAAQTLAEASGMALPAAADSLVTALNQMGVGASQAERYINVMAAGAKVGASEVAESSQALKDFATTAASVGVSFEAANAAIQGLAKAGIKGGEAGNALRNVMLKLETDTDSKLRPSLHGLTGSLEALGEKNLSTAAMTKMFGLENINAAKALIANTGTIKEFEVAMTGTNVAHEQATINTDNYATSVKRMQAAMNAAAITVGAMLTPALKAGADAVTAIAVEISEGSDRINTVLKLLETAAVIAAGALAGPLVSAMAAAAVRAAATASAIGAAGLAVKAFNVVLAGLGGPIGIAITALSLLVLNWDKIAGSSESAAQISERSANRIASALKKPQMTADKDLAAQQADAEKLLAETEKNIADGGRGFFGGQADPSVMRGYQEQRDAIIQSLRDIKAARDKLGGGAGRGSVNPDAVTPAAEVKPAQVDPDLVAKNAKYLASLRAQATQDALEKIRLAEAAALADNAEAARKGEITAKTSAEAKTLIHARYAAERIAITEKEIQDDASARISMTLDESARVLAIREEAIRKANAAEKAGTATAAQAARERALARFVADRQIAAIADKQAADRAEIAVALAATEAQRIELVRAEALRKVNEAERRGDIDAEQAAGRRAIANRTADDQIIASRERIGQQRQQAQTQTLQIKAELEGPAASGAKEELIRQQAAAQQVAVDEARRMDLENAQVYADQKVAIEQRMQMQIMELQAATQAAQYAMVQSAAGQVLDVLRRAGKDRTALGKAVFLAEKALAVATIIINTEMGAAKAVGIAGPFGLPLAGVIRAAGYTSAGMVAGMALADAFGGGRQYGGPVSADKMYRVNETGQPEMFTAANGAQYMLPNKGGSVTPASEVGAGGVQWRIIINNNATGATASASVDDSSRTVTIAVNEVASQISERRGPVWGAMRTTSVQGRPA